MKTYSNTKKENYNSDDYKAIEIIGLCNPYSINLDLSKNNMWTQMSIPENLVVPEQKPQIDEVSSINIEVQILQQKVITTPDSSSAQGGKNREGRKLTGRKLTIEGLLCETVLYISDTEERTVNSIQYAVPFSASIILKPIIANVDAKLQEFAINVCIEDVFIIYISPRRIIKNTTLFLQAVPIKQIKV